MWTVYGDTFSTGDMTNADRSMRFSPIENNVLLTMRTWIILYNPPNFTNLVAKLYSDREGLPGALIATSVNSYNKADVLTTGPYGLKDIYFTFSPKISLSANLYYHFVLNCSGYTYAEESHIAWRKGWPDPIYGTATFNNLLTQPYMCPLIGAKL